MGTFCMGMLAIPAFLDQLEDLTVRDSGWDVSPVRAGSSWVS